MLTTSMQFFSDGVLRFEKDHDTRKAREYDEDGTLMYERDYTAEENAEADAIDAQNVLMTNEQALRDGLQAVIAAALERQAQVQAVIDTPNADIRQNPAPHIIALARASKRQERAIIRLARLAGGLLDTADTGTD